MKFYKFSTPTCSACKLLSKYLDNLKQEGYNIDVEEIDATENAYMAQRYLVTSVPVLVSEDGSKRITGFSPMKTRAFFESEA